MNRINKNAFTPVATPHFNHSPHNNGSFDNYPPTQTPVLNQGSYSLDNNPLDNNNNRQQRPMSSKSNGRRSKNMSLQPKAKARGRLRDRTNSDTDNNNNNQFLSINLNVNQKQNDGHLQPQYSGSQTPMAPTAIRNRSADVRGRLEKRRHSALETNSNQIYPRSRTPNARLPSAQQQYNQRQYGGPMAHPGGAPGGPPQDDEKQKDPKLAKQDAAFRERIEGDIIDESPDVSFRDVQGLEPVKLALYESIILPALRPDVFTGLRAPATGLLLFGPPGNGKTMIAKCVAAECEATFFSISASSITSKFVGDAERIMRTLFTIARERSPSIIFIDEIDSLLTARGGKNEAESSRRIKTEFLIQFDGVKKASDADARILVIGATNLPEQLDDAVLRRFQKRILVPLPDKDTRFGLIKSMMRKQKHDINDNDWNKIVVKTKGYSCSDLANLCKDAAMGPVRDLGADILDPNAKMPSIALKHFDEGVKNVRPSLPIDSVKHYHEWNSKYGSKISLSAKALPESMRPRDPEAESSEDEEENIEDEFLSEDQYNNLNPNGYYHNEQHDTVQPLPQQFNGHRRGSRSSGNLFGNQGNGQGGQRPYGGRY